MGIYQMIDIDKFFRLPWPVQSRGEWLHLFEFLQSYFGNRGIDHPVVVEIGIQSNLQKRFYRDYLGAEHIGIDIADKYSRPDILGDALRIEAFNALCERLADGGINLLFLDAGQSYGAVSSYFKIYEPLVKDIIILHPILTTPAHPDGTKLFWQNLFDKEKEKYEFITFYSHVGPEDPCFRYQYGTGLLIKR